jgi:hypothetical protein
MITFFLGKVLNVVLYDAYQYFLKNPVLSIAIAAAAIIILYTLITRKNWKAVLFESAKSGNIEALKKALSALGTNSVDIKDDNGSTALIVASFYGHYPIVVELINQKAKVAAEDFNHNNALMAASVNGHFEIAQLLVKRGARVKAKR